MARPRRPELHPRLADFRQQRGLTQEQVAERIGINPEMVRRHEKGLAQPISLYRERYSSLFRATQEELGLVIRADGEFMPELSIEPSSRLHATTSVCSPLDEINDLIAEISDSATTDTAISQLSQATVSLAESHTQAPARRVLTEVLRLHQQARIFVQGRQRLGQRRELFRIESDLLAHACLLFGDLKQNHVAEKYGVAALAFANEAESDQAISRTALAKTLRWAERLIESADMAKLGFECSSPTPVRIQLASQEANAAAILGDARRAGEALRRAEAAAETAVVDSGLSAWSFPIGRQAIFALSVATQTGDPNAALRAAAMADEGWANGEPMVQANWAQIRVGSGIAHLSKGCLDEAIEEVAPVLTLRPELRVSTVTGYMDDLDRRLSHPRLASSKAALELRQGIHNFNSAALLDDYTARRR